MRVDPNLRKKLEKSNDPIRWERFPPLGNPDDPDTRVFSTGKECLEWLEAREVDIWPGNTDD